MSATTASSRRFYNPVQKDYATFLETSEESGGARTLIQVELAPRGGNALHRHLTYAEHGFAGGVCAGGGRADASGWDASESARARRAGLVVGCAGRRVAERFESGGGRVGRWVGGGGSTVRWLHGM